MSWLSRLFGSGAKSNAPTQAIEYEGYRIYPEPRAEEGQFRLAARIEAEIDGETKVHQLIRADLIRDRSDAEDSAVLKAKQMIDQMGPRLFD